MSEKMLKRRVVEATRAEITFADGRTRTLISRFEDSQGGNGYDGGHWGLYPDFRKRVEDEIRDAQRLWSLPSATIRYTRITRTVETVERTTTSEKHYSERTVTREVTP